MQTLDVSRPTSATRRPRRSPLYVLYAANAISAIGDVLAFLAVPWFVLQTTGSLTQTGIAAACTTAAVAVSAFFGAAVVDRLGFRRASVISDLASGVSIALIPLLYLLGQLAFWQLLALVFFAGFFTTPGGTARTALVPDLVDLAQARMERVTATSDGIRRISVFLGAPIAGVLIALTSTSNLLWIDAATFAVSALLIRLAVPSGAGHVKRDAVQPPAQVSAAGRRGPLARVGRYFRDLSQGARFIVRDGVIFSIIVTVMLTNLLDAGFGGVLAPAYIRQVYGDPVVLGIMIAIFGGAAFLGTVLFGAIGHRLPRRQTFGIGFTIGGGTRFLVLALAPIVPVLLAVQVVTGLCIGPINPLISTISFERVPTDLRARVFGTTTAGAMLGTPLGALLAGFSAAWMGTQATLVVFGAVYLLATLSLLVNPALKGMARRTSSNDSTDGAAPALEPSPATIPEAAAPASP
jgi:MFS family permease